MTEPVAALACETCGLMLSAMEIAESRSACKWCAPKPKPIASAPSPNLIPRGWGGRSTYGRHRNFGGNYGSESTEVVGQGTVTATLKSVRRGYNFTASARLVQVDGDFDDRVVTVSIGNRRTILDPLFGLIGQRVVVTGDIYRHVAATGRIGHISRITKAQIRAAQ